MSHGIEKETYMKADERTTKGLTFDLLDKVYEKVEKLEKRKRRDTAISTGSGVLGGYLAVISLSIRKWFLN